MTVGQPHTADGYNVGGYKSRVGERFGRLRVTREFKKPDNVSYFVECLCDCGNVTVILKSALKGVRPVRSCGCLRVETTRERSLGNVYGRKYDDPTRAARNALIDSYQRNAIRRGYEWTLTETDCLSLFQSPCRFCGLSPSTHYKRPRSSPLSWYRYTGIDRLDNSAGYTISNVVPCCASCNAAKADMPLDKFLEWLARITAHAPVRQVDGLDVGVVNMP